MNKTSLLMCTNQTNIKHFKFYLLVKKPPIISKKKQKFNIRVSMKLFWETMFFQINKMRANILCTCYNANLIMFSFQPFLSQPFFFRHFSEPLHPLARTCPNVVLKAGNNADCFARAMFDLLRVKARPGNTPPVGWHRQPGLYPVLR